ncbi:MAG: glycerol kinase GlpK [Candidatus Alcyoniella australis]|nr:glycerol kinase GlpK [Candidatus Alcyoniella australis]
MKYVLAIDQGTTGSTVLIIDANQQVVARGYAEFPQIFPEPGWVEHDPEQIWFSVEKTIAQALQVGGIDATQIAAIGITNQRETTVLWDRQSSLPAYNAIVWQDRRTASICTELKQRGLEPTFTRKSGLLLDPYFSGTKLTWLLRNVEGLRQRAESGELAFGTIDSFLVWRLSNGAAHVTDVSNASRTLLLDLESCAWDEELLAALEVPRAILPEVRSNSEVYAQTKGLRVLPDGIPIAGMAGDQQAALFGQACFEPGQAKCTYGTGSFVLINVGDKPVHSEHRLLSTVAWQINGRTTYALEGSVFICGAAVQWLRDQLGIIAKSSDVEPLARKVESSEGVFFVPAMVGLGAPYWRPDATGTIVGIRRGTSSAHIARATLEAMALQNVDVIRAMENDSKQPVAELKVDGGAAANDLLMELQSGLLGTRIVRPQMLDTTALGAALLAGLAVGVWSDLETIREKWRAERVFEPAMDTKLKDRLLDGWAKAVEKSF